MEYWPNANQQPSERPWYQEPPHSYPHSPYRAPYQSYPAVPVKPPPVWHVVVFTAFTSPLLGLIGPAWYGEKAARQGFRQAPYWVAWLITSVIWVCLFMAVSSLRTVL